MLPGKTPTFPKLGVSGHPGAIQTIERRQRKLLEAHYNDAIPIDMLRAEQKRLDTELSATNRSLSNLTADLAEADELISIALDIAQHAGNTYRQAPEHIRRMFNQLLFDKLLVTTDDNGQHHGRCQAG